MSDLNKIQAERIARFKKMGLPSTAGQINESTTVVTGNQSAYKALQDIKRGANKEVFKKFVQAESTAGAADSGYQIPVTKPSAKRRPGQPQEKSEHAVAPAVFGVKKSEEASSLESMLLGDMGVSVTSTMGKMGAPQGDIVSDISGPSFDPVAHLQNKMATGGSKPQQPVYQESNQISEMKDMIQGLLENQTPSGNMEVMKEMMYTIAKQVAETTMKTVINEFLAESKKKNIYEVYSKEQNVVKINNKLYKLTPVKIKGH